MSDELPRDGRLISLEYEPRHAEVAHRNITAAGPTGSRSSWGKRWICSPGSNATGRGRSDMVFIDADKPPYADYLKAALRLARPGTLIVADNVVRGGRWHSDPATIDPHRDPAVRWGTGDDPRLPPPSFSRSA